MTISFPRLPWRPFGGGNTYKEIENEPTEKSAKLNHSSELAPSNLKKTKNWMKKTKREWLGREEERLGNVVFPKPDDPEWSIGWVEPHGPGFKTQDDCNGDEDNGGFVVLVLCYKKVMDESGNHPLTVHKNLPNEKNIEQWMSSISKL